MPGQDELETVVTALGERRGVLVLDNFEQVLDAAPDVARLAAATPATPIVVTSRAPLRIGAELTYAVPPLPLPSPDATAVETIERAAATRLYVERACAAYPSGALTDANATAVARICRAVDGIPLALELAAARVRSLGAEGTAARLDDMLALLSRGARDSPERQWSLRATIDWSVRLLDEPARSVLGVRRCSSVVAPRSTPSRRSRRSRRPGATSRPLSTTCSTPRSSDASTGRTARRA